jgi:hypothetical protein
VFLKKFDYLNACSKQGYPSVVLAVRAFDTHTMTWTIFDVYGKSPVRFASSSLFTTHSIVLFAG